ncbi:response regulator, partial [Pseudomonas aeruginosa]|uniref:response regulator n=1 Tax=Pseudomonas aeruginosa TaxID=287 RepID=UPI00215654AD
MSPSPVRILFVDDEERILRSLAMQFRRHYEVLTESDPRRALERLKTERIQVLVSDQRMPQMSGAELLAQARERYPETLRILLTGYSDLDAAVDALNDGGIFRYLTKPWNPQEMAFTLRQAAEIASRQGLPAAGGGSRRRLGGEPIDLYLLHWQGRYPLEETIEAFDRLR